MITKNINSYSIYAISMAFIGLPIYIYLPDYYNKNFNLSLQFLAAILLISRLIDALQDPIFGLLSDKYAKNRKKTIAYLSPFLGLSFLCLFNPPASTNITIWLTCFLIITYSIFSMIYINYTAYAVAISNDYHFKTKIISLREIYFILGIIIAAVMPAILFNYYSEIESFLIMGIFYIVMICSLAIIFNKYAPDNKYNNNSKPDIKSLIRNKNLKAYFLMFLFNSFSSAIPAILIIFFVENIIEAKNLLGLFLLSYFSGLFIGVLIWKKISIILNDKIKTFLISLLFTAFIFSFCIYLSKGDIYPYLLICLMAGIGFGGDLILSYSILTDIIQKHKLQKSESMIFSINNFIIKITLTLSSAILIYMIGHYENQPQTKSEFISFSYVILPVTFRILSAFTLHKNFNHKYYD